MHLRVTTLVSRSLAACGISWFIGITGSAGAVNELAATNAVFVADHPEMILLSCQDWGELGLNVAAHADGIPGQKLAIGKRSYDQGLGHHANGIITLPLEGNFCRFDSEVGVQPCQGGTVRFRIVADGQILFESAVLRSGDEPIKLRVDVSGKQELQLQTEDAGDGITCDVANWALARLTPAGKRAETAQASVDVARFGRVATWDPARLDGARADRVQEFRTADLFTETPLKARPNGAYRIPAATNNLCCIGVQWLNRRWLRETTLEFLDPTKASTHGIRVEGWFGESAWQGGWKPLNGELVRERGRVTFRFPGSVGNAQTSKLRWLLPASAEKAEVRLTVLSRSTWATTNLFLQLEKPLAKIGSVTVFNGEWTTGPRLELPWPLSEPLRVRVRYSRPSVLNSDPTMLRFKLPAGEVGVNVSDVLSNDCVYLPDLGLFVTRDPVPVGLAEYKRRIENRQSVLEQVRAAPEQTFAQAMSKTHHEFQREGPVMLSLACDNSKFIVERDGLVRFHPKPFTWLGGNQQVDWQPWYANAGELKAAFGHGANPQPTRTLEGGWLPIPLISANKDGIRYTQRMFVAPAGPLNAASWVQRSVCVAEFIASNTGPVSLEASLSISVKANSRANTPALLARTETGFVALVDGQPVAHLQSSDPPMPMLDTAAGNAQWRRTLGKGEAMHIVAYLPGSELTARDIAALPQTNLRDATEKYWKGMLARSLQVETPDESLNNVIRSSQVRCLIAARSEAEGTRFGASIAAMSYGSLESEAHSVIRGMDYFGHSEFGQRSLDYFIHRYNTNGFLTTGYTTFGTAWHLWTVGEHFRLTRDTNWLRQVAPEIARVGRWIREQTSKTEHRDVSGGLVPEYGLMPPGVLADWNSFACHFAMNAYYSAGLIQAGGALREIGHPDGQRLMRQGERLRSNTLRAYEWTRSRSPALGLRNGSWIAHYPSQVHSPGKLANFFPGQDAGRSWCYDVELGAHQLVPTGVLQPNSLEVDRMLDHMEDVQFLSDGWFDYPAAMNQQDWFNLGGFSKVQPYYTRNCEIYALRDEVKPFIRSYFNSLASLLNPEVLTLWEHFRHSGAWDKTHETGYFLHQTRTMLVQERGDALWLAPFMPAAWLEDGKRLEVRQAPTTFGRVSYRIQSQLSRGIIDLVVEPPERSPRSIVVRLRHPEGKPIRAVTVGGRYFSAFDAKRQTISLKPGKTPLRVQVQF